MKLNKINDQILHFEADSLKELTLTFCRIQEFYESPFDHIRGKKFDMFDFVSAYTRDDGHFDYFSSWHGFNFPSYVFFNWRKLHTAITKPERNLLRMIKANTDSRPFYVIATLSGANSALDHEVAHAMFYLYDDYKAEVLEAINQIDPALQLIFNQQFAHSMGYGENVFADETHAYLATSPDDYLKEHFFIEADDYRETINKFVGLFEKYNKKVRGQE